MKNYTDPRDAAALEARRRRLAAELDAMAHIRRAHYAGTATPDMMEGASRRRYLLEVLDGPKPDRVAAARKLREDYRRAHPRIAAAWRQRGAVDVLALVLLTWLACAGVMLSERHGDKVAARDGCGAVVGRMLEAERAGHEERAMYWRNTMTRNSCYLEDYYDGME